MKVTKLAIPEVLLIEPSIYLDDRGLFFESFNEDKFNQKTGLNIKFVQDNISYSKKGVLRGLHFQLPPFEQAKLVQVLQGRVLDVAVDIRKDSPTYSQYVSVELSVENHKHLFIPRGFAHGFLALTDDVLFSYKCDNYYTPKYDSGIIYNDPSIAIDWGVNQNFIISDKDLNLNSLLI